MRTTLRTMIVVGLMLVLLVLALPAMSTTSDLDSGVVLIDGDVLAPANTSAKTIAYVEATHTTPAIVGTHTGALNIAD